MATQIQVPIEGMTCAACEQRVGAALLNLPGVIGVEVSAKRSAAVIDTTVSPDQQQLAEIVERAGYTLGSTPWLSHDRRTWLVTLAASVIVAVLVGLAIAVDLPDLGARVSAPGVGGLAVVALVGLAAGVSTCMALVGGVVLAVAATYRVPDDASQTSALRPHLAFQLGRVAGFFVLGAGLGWLGSVLVLPPLVQALFMLVVAMVIALLGLRLTGVSPRLAAWSPTLPARWARRVGTVDVAGSYSDSRAALAGAATFFLPCGFTQAVQLYALSSGSPLTAGITMAVFALGTAPGLLALAGLPAVARGRGAAVVLSAVGVLLIGFAAINVYGAVHILGLNPDSSTAEASRALSPNVRLQDGVQVVTMVADGNGYSPATTYVAADLPIRWEITSTAPFYCTAFLRAPDFGVRMHLVGGLNTVNVPPLAPGSWPFACVMGMYDGTLVAVDVGESPATAS